MKTERWYDFFSDLGWDVEKYEYDGKTYIALALGRPVTYGFSFSVNTKDIEHNIIDYVASFSEERLVRKWIVEHPEDDVPVSKLMKEAGGIKDGLLAMISRLRELKNEDIIQLLDDLCWNYAYNVEFVNAQNETVRYSEVFDCISKTLPSDYIFSMLVKHDELVEGLKKQLNDFDKDAYIEKNVEYREGSVREFLEDVDQIEEYVKELEEKLSEIL